MKTPLAVSLSMMMLMPFSAMAETASGGSVVAAQDRTVALTRSCMSKMRAPGRYAVSVNVAIPNVIPDEGGTSSGASMVRDCLHDQMNVHYPALGVTTAEANGGGKSQSRSAYCPKGAGVIYGGTQYCRL